MVLACLLAFLAQHPVSAQCNSCGPWVQDASSSSTDENGNMNVDVVAYSGGDSPDSWVYTDYGSLYIPGATVPAYVDCDCDSQSANGPYSGFWDFSSEGTFEYL